MQRSRDRGARQESQCSCLASECKERDGEQDQTHDSACDVARITSTGTLRTEQALPLAQPASRACVATYAPAPRAPATASGSPLAAVASSARPERPDDTIKRTCSICPTVAIGTERDPSTNPALFRHAVAFGVRTGLEPQSLVWCCGSDRVRAGLKLGLLSRGAAPVCGRSRQGGADALTRRPTAYWRWRERPRRRRGRRRTAQLEPMWERPKFWAPFVMFGG